MIIDGFNTFLKTTVVINENGRYQCPIELHNGEWFFYFKRQWHRIDDYISDNATICEVDYKDGKTLRVRPYKKK